MLFSLKIAEYVGKGDELWKSMHINLFFMNSLAEVKNAKMQKMHSTIFPHTGARIIRRKRKKTTTTKTPMLQKNSRQTVILYNRCLLSPKQTGLKS